MPEPRSYIQILAPERLREIIMANREPEARRRLADAILRLLELNTAYISNEPVDGTRTVRVATWLPDHTDLGEIGWTIMQDPEPDGFRGHRVINGGLIHHRDHTWGIHT